MNGLTRAADLAPVLGEPVPYDGYTVRPISLQVFDGFRVTGAVWEPADPSVAVLVPHGHFGQGKSSGEVQSPAHALAANGALVLALDTPGVEEGDTPARQIHFDDGAGNRAMLEAANTSAMAVQLHALQAGLDWVDQRGGVEKIGVTGSSGGSVQALYLSFVDPRVDAIALASFVPMPREARAGGCACDALPGWPGPDPALYAATPVPSLWMSEVPQERPAGLPRSAEFVVLEGPHGYEAPMVEAMLEFFSDELGLSDRHVQPAHTPSTALVSEPPGGALADLVTPQHRAYQARPYTLEKTCVGKGPRIYTFGEVPAVEGHEMCAVQVALTPIDLEEGVIRREPVADRIGNAMSSLRGTLHIEGPHALVAERAGVAFTPIGELVTCDDLSPQSPSWAWGACPPASP